MCFNDNQDGHHDNADHGGDDSYEAPINLEVDFVVIF